jgi:hypothetical protein
MVKYPKYNDINGCGSGASTGMNNSEENEMHDINNNEVLDPNIIFEHMRQLAGIPGSIARIHPMKWIEAHSEFSEKRNKPEYISHILNSTIDQQIENRKKYNIPLDANHRQFLSSIFHQRQPI